MKTLLVNLPWRRGKLYGIRAGSRWPFMLEPESGKKIPGYMPFPFFLAYAAALLEKNNIDVNLIDSLAEGYSDEEFINKAKEYGPEMIVIETSTPSINTDLEWVEKLKKEIPSALIALCGTHATVFSEELLKENPGIEYVLRGEYEFMLLELMQSLEKKESPGNIKGITFREGERIIENPDRPLIDDINEFPWPARKFLPMYSYNDEFAGFPVPNVQVWASRGCPFKCVFCNWPKTIYGGTRYRTRDVKDTVDEIEYLLKEYGFKGFYFDDDTFNIGKERILSICEEIKKRGIKVPWAVMARADTSDFETLKAMKEAGLYAIKFGVESGVQEIVDRSGKRLDLKKVKENVKNAKKLGIKVHLTFTFGLPGETAGTIRQTIKFAKETDPDSVQFSVVTPFPGTLYFDELDKKGYIASRNWDDYDGANRAVIRTADLTDKELVDWCNRAIREWNRFLLFSRLMKRPVKTLINALKNPSYIPVFLKGLFRK